MILTNFNSHVLRAEPLLHDVTVNVNAGRDVNTTTEKHRGTRVTVCNAGIGAAATSNVIEELIDLGGKVFIQVGATGAIQDYIARGDTVIPTGSARDEAVTRYYAPRQYPAVADYRIVHALVSAAKAAGKTVHTGIIRTTDGFYPSQRIEKYVRRYGDLGVLSVEQEVSAILRSLLGFLHLEGILLRSLAGSVPRVAAWRLAPLPRGLTHAEVQRLPLRKA